MAHSSKDIQACYKTGYIYDIGSVLYSIKELMRFIERINIEDIQHIYACQIYRNEITKFQRYNTWK